MPHEPDPPSVAATLPPRETTGAEATPTPRGLNDTRGGEDAPPSCFRLPAYALWRREVTAFVRKKSRVVGALGTPLVFWVLIGSGLRHAVKLGGTGVGSDYMVYAFPGMIVLVVLFTAIFSMISVIEDRRAGFMQAVLAAPVNRSAIVTGKVLGCATLAAAQGLLLLLASPWVGIPLTLTRFLGALGVLGLLSVGLSGVGFLAAWPLDSTQGFHSVMNLVLMPMWLLSGAFFPAEGAAAWIRWIMVVNPLTYGVTALQYALGVEGTRPVTSFPVALAVTAVSTLVALVLASRIVGRGKGTRP